MARQAGVDTVRNALTPKGRRLVLSFILFYISLNFSLATFSTIGNILSAFYAIMLIGYITAYGLNESGSRNVSEKHLRALWYICTILFIASAALFIGLGQASFQLISVFIYTFSYLLVIVILAFLSTLLFYFKDNRIRAALLLAILAITAIYFVGSITKYTADDETVIAAYGIKYLLMGINPYTQSINAVLYNMLIFHQINGLTISTANTIVSVMDYPALYFLVQIPFYLLINPALNPQVLGLSFLHLQAGAFFIILLLSLGYLGKEQKSINPQFLAYILLAIASLILASFIIYLMMALIILMYTGIGRKYPWLILGIILSLQEQLWTLALLFFLYYFNTYGIKRGLKVLLGSACVFLLINGYFIALSPSSYFGNVLTPLTTSFPSFSASVGYLLASIYPMPLNSFAILFATSFIIAAILALYINDRKLLPLFSMVPFFFMTHGLVLYYTLPMFVSAVLLYYPAMAEEKGWLKSACEKEESAADFIKAVQITLVALTLVAIFYFHAQWLSAFGITAQNQTAVYIGYNSVLYNSSIIYHGTSGSAKYLAMLFTQGGSTSYYGLFNSSLTNTTLCAYPCINNNELSLIAGAPYNLSIYVPANIMHTTYASAIIYNKYYYYKSPPILVSR